MSSQVYDSYQPGQVVGNNYEIVELIGKGSLGAVYQAHDLELDETIALKIFHSQFSETPHMIDRFREKIKQVRQISATGIATLHSFGNDQGNYYLAMELVPGKDLGKLLAQGSLSIEQSQKLMIALCDILKPVHAAGCIHGNLKPRNIIIANNTTIKIIDFGFADPEDLARFPGLFDARYMAPEQVYPIDATPAVDIYSLGIIYYQMLTGKTPFASDSLEDLIYKHAHSKPEPPSSFNSSLPPLTDIIMVKLLHKDSNKRFQSVKSFKDILTFKTTICPRCKKEHAADRSCPLCSDLDPQLSDEAAASDKSLQEIIVQKEKMHPALDRLQAYHQKIKKISEVQYHVRCMYCAHFLPENFPFCPKCFLDVPFEGREEPRTLILTGIDNVRNKNKLLSFLKLLNPYEDLPPKLMKTRELPCIVSIQDYPERASELINEFRELEVRLRPIDPNNFDEIIHLNSWTFPLTAGGTTLVTLFLNPLLAVIPLGFTIYAVNRNLKKLNLPEVKVFMDKFPGILSTPIIKLAKDISAHIKTNDLLHLLYETILFRAFILLEMMKKNKEIQNVFAEIVQSIEQLIYRSGKNAEALYILEKNFDLNTEHKLNHAIEALQKKSKEKLPPQYEKALTQKIALKKEQRADFYNLAKQIADHYATLIEIWESLEKMKPKVSNIMSEMIAYESGRKQEDKALVREILTDISVLEQSFLELDE